MANNTDIWTVRVKCGLKHGHSLYLSLRTQETLHNTRVDIIIHERHKFRLRESLQINAVDVNLTLCVPGDKLPLLSHR